jgi:hypothetical protein
MNAGMAPGTHDDASKRRISEIERERALYEKTIASMEKPLRVLEEQDALLLEKSWRELAFAMGENPAALIQ